MKRATAICAVMAVSVVVGLSQSWLPENRALRVSVVEGEHVWKLEPDKEVWARDTFGPYAEYKNNTLIADPRRVHGEFAAEEFGSNKEMREGQIDAFAHSIIRKSHHSLIQQHPGVLRAVHSDNAVGEVAYVLEEHLAECPGWSHFTCVAGPYKSEPASLQHHVSKQREFREEVWVESTSGYLFVSATVERIRELLDVAREYEESHAIELRVYDLPAGVGDPEIAALPKLMKGRMYNRIATPDRKRLIVRATREAHLELSALIPNLKPADRRED